MMQLEDVPLENKGTRPNHQLSEYVLERKNNMKPKTCWGRIFTHWSQFFTVSIVAGGIGIAIYEFVKKQQVIAAIAAAMAVTGVFLHFLITCLVPRKRVEEELDEMKNNADRFLLVEKEMGKEEDKQQDTLKTIKIEDDNIGQHIDKLKNTQIQLIKDRRESFEEINDTEKKMEVYINKIKELTEKLLFVSKENERLEKTCQEIKQEENNLKDQLKKATLLNENLGKNVQTLDKETSHLQQVDEKINVDIQKLQEDSKQLKELSQKFEEISKVNKELEEELKKTRLQKEEFEKKLKEININLEKGTQKLELTANELIEKISVKEKELKEIMEKYEQYSLRYEEIKKKIENLEIKLIENEKENN